MSNSPVAPGVPRSRRLPRAVPSCAAWLFAAWAVSACGPSAPREPDLPKQEDRWVDAVPVGDDTKVKFVGRTRDYLVTNVSGVRDVGGVRAVQVGDEVEGVRVGAIKCSFHWRDASYGGEQYMWRGRWACMAGRTQEEIATAVAEDGAKRYDYLHISPVSLPGD